MRNLVLVAFLFAITGATYAEFVLEHVDVVISDIQPDGSVHVHESIKMIVFGNYSTALYDSALSSADLAVWSSDTGLKEMKLHINPAKVQIEDLRVRPQPRTRCNPIQDLCHGELVLDYVAVPKYNESAGMQPIPGTSVFDVEKYKPRTKRYSINPTTLSFTASGENSMLLGNQVALTIQLPQGAVLRDLNPQPPYQTVVVPGPAKELSWSDIVLVKFSLVFDVEDSIDKEVTDFFTDFLSSVVNILRGPQGLAVIALIIILVGSYLYIVTAKRRGEE